MKELSIKQTQHMLKYIADHMIEQEVLLCELDGKIGDGDHGIGIARGFQAVSEEMLKDFFTINELFQQAGFALMNSMGGASGIIFSSIFLGALSDTKQETELNISVLQRYFRNGLERIKQKGGAELGDKTMLDAFEPAVISIEGNKQEELNEVFRKAALAAQLGVEATKNYAAKFGRAKFLGERSIGHCDAGAKSVALIFGFASEYLEKEG